MQGFTHALSGATAFLAVAAPLSNTIPLDFSTVALGTVTAAGAALLPDLDHPHATAARTFGPISEALSKGVSTISGGHRHATHSILGAGVFAAAAVLIVQVGGWPLALLLAMCIGLADRALLPRAKPRKDGRLQWGDIAGFVHAVAAVAVGYALAHSTLDMAVVPYAVTIGVVIHILGDALTEKGVPFFWPKLRYFRFATIDTGKSVEKWLVVPALYAAFAVAAYATRDIWMPSGALLGTWMPGGHLVGGG